MKRDIAILAVGDKKDYDAYKKFHKRRRMFLEKGFEYATVGYRDVLQGRFPHIEAERVIIFFFFPFYYWDKYIEHRHYKGIYGNIGFYRKFGTFCRRLQDIFIKGLAGKKVFFVNRPDLSAFYRDKVTVKKKLTKCKIPTPRLYHFRGVEDIRRMLGKGHSFFLKPRCGSMGKGITFLSCPEWQTNFIFKNNKIISKRTDKDWRFRDITGNHIFLRRILRKDIMAEEAIDMLILNKKKVDLRIYTFFNEVIYVYPRKNRTDRVTTNITQGGRGDPALLEVIPVHLLRKAESIARKASKALGLSLAGIDIVLSRNLKDAYVVDINAFPGFPKQKTFDIAVHIANRLIALAKRGRIHFKYFRSMS